MAIKDRILARWRDYWHVDTYRCRACGWEIAFSKWNLRRHGIDPAQMFHKHTVTVTNREIVSYPMTNLEPKFELVME